MAYVSVEVDVDIDTDVILEKCSVQDLAQALVARRNWEAELATALEKSAMQPGMNGECDPVRQVCEAVKYGKDATPLLRDLAFSRYSLILN